MVGGNWILERPGCNKGLVKPGGATTGAVSTISSSNFFLFMALELLRVDSSLASALKISTFSDGTSVDMSRKATILK